MSAELAEAATGAGITGAAAKKERIHPLSLMGRENSFRFEIL